MSRWPVNFLFLEGGKGVSNEVSLCEMHAAY